jgi:hypothetical protein
LGGPFSVDVNVQVKFNARAGEGQSAARAIAAEETPTKLNFLNIDLVQQNYFT